MAKSEIRAYTMPPEILGLPAYHPYNMFRLYGAVIPQAAP